MELQNRHQLIDNAKALGIVLVVLGHASGIPSDVVTVIFSFHMPLFFFLSGFLLSDSKLQLRPTEYAGRLLRDLGVPYLLFCSVSFIYWICTRNLGARSHKFADVAWYEPFYGFVSGVSAFMIVNPTLWFFPCLMLASFIYQLLRRRFEANIVVAIAVALGFINVLLVDRLPTRLPWGLDNCWVALVFFAVGQWIRVANTGWSHKRPSSAFLCLAGVTAFGMSLVLSQVNGRTDLSGGGFGVHPLLYFPMAFLGIAWILALSSLLPRWSAFDWLARSTLVIFPTHPLVMNFLSGLGKLVFHLPENLLQTPIWGVTTALVAVLACFPATVVLSTLLPQTFGRGINHRFAARVVGSGR